MNPTLFPIGIPPAGMFLQCCIKIFFIFFHKVGSLYGLAIPGTLSGNAVTSLQNLRSGGLPFQSHFITYLPVSFLTVNNAIVTPLHLAILIAQPSKQMSAGRADPLYARAIIFKTGSL